MKTLETGKTKTGKIRSACERARNAFRAINPLTEKNRDRALGVACGATALIGVPMGVVLTIDVGSSESPAKRLGAFGIALATSMAIGLYEAVVVERLLKKHE
ncbi:TPA: hypothetical protein HA238_01430 [Candidatus Micrarchaeota archaeon]|nr:hypothetical protein [Candidatus Micrarchaeota archaeon]